MIMFLTRAPRGFLIRAVVCMLSRLRAAVADVSLTKIPDSGVLTKGSSLGVSVTKELSVAEDVWEVLHRLAFGRGGSMTAESET